MANILGKRVLNLDTPATITVGGSGQLDINQMIWTGCTDGDDLVITVDGQAIAFKQTDAIMGAGQAMQILQCPVGICYSFALTTIDAGNLLVFLN